MRAEKKNNNEGAFDWNKLPLLQSLADEDTNSRSLQCPLKKGVLISHTANVHTLLKITVPKIHPFQDGIMNFEVLNIWKSLDENHILELFVTQDPENHILFGGTYPFRPPNAQQEKNAYTDGEQTGYRTAVFWAAEK